MQNKREIRDATNSNLEINATEALYKDNELVTAMTATKCDDCANYKLSCSAGSILGKRMSKFAFENKRKIFDRAEFTIAKQYELTITIDLESEEESLDKYVKRPPRKAYGRLSADSDDGSSMKHKIDDPFDDLDNFEMIAPVSGGNNTNGNDALRTSMVNGCTHAVNDGGICNVGNCAGVGNNSVCHAPDCQGNFVNNDFCSLNMEGLCSGSNANGLVKSNSSSLRTKEVNENTINRIQAMAMSDDDDYDESLTCNVCDRAFHCHRQLASHQQKKRHFGCGGCDSLFPSLMLLEHHKEEFEHWSDDEISRRICCRRNRGDDYFTDTDSFTSEAESEDLERLL